MEGGTRRRTWIVLGIVSVVLVAGALLGSVVLQDERAGDEGEQVGVERPTDADEGDAPGSVSGGTDEKRHQRRENREREPTIGPGSSEGTSGNRPAFQRGEAVEVRGDVFVYRDSERVHLEQSFVGKIVDGPRKKRDGVYYEVRGPRKAYWVPRLRIDDFHGTVTTHTPVQSGRSFAAGERVLVDHTADGYREDGADMEHIPDEGTIVEGPKTVEGEQTYLIDSNSTYRYWVPTHEIRRGTRRMTPIDPFTKGEAVESRRNVEVWYRGQPVRIFESLVGTVTSDRNTYRGKVWYEVQAGGKTFWVHQRDLRGIDDQRSATSKAPRVTPVPRDGSISVGDHVETTSMTWAWRGEDRDLIYPAVTGEVLDGPREFRDTTWYEVDSTEGVLWIRASDLQALRRNPMARPSDETPWTFASGDTVTYVDQAYSVYRKDGPRARLEIGRQGTVVAGPRQYKREQRVLVDTSVGSYWVPSESLYKGTKGAIPTRDVRAENCRQNSQCKPTTKYVDQDQLRFESGDSVTLRSSRTVHRHGHELVDLPKGTRGTITDRLPKKYHYDRIIFDRDRDYRLRIEGGTVVYKVQTKRGTFWVPQTVLEPRQ
jgi:hypothetical protein